MDNTKEVQERLDFAKRLNASESESGSSVEQERLNFAKRLNASRSESGSSVEAVKAP